TDTSSSGTGSYTRTWQLGDGGTADSAVAHHSYLPGTYQVMFLAITDHGCRDSVSQQITVIPYPKPVVGLTQNSLGQCFPGNLSSFRDSSSVDPGALSTYWDFGDGTAATDKTALKSYTAPGDYRVRLVATSDKGCKDSAFRQLAVYDPPHAGFTVNN